MKNVILFIFSIIICVVVFPVAFVFSIFFNERTEYLFNICIGLDQLGNVVCRRLFDLILVNDDYFGNPDETISSAIGRAKLAGDLTWLGRALDMFLNLFDKNHSIKSIEDDQAKCSG